MKPQLTADAKIAAAVRADPDVAQLTAYLASELPAGWADLVTKDYFCAVRRATIAALTGADRHESANRGTHRPT